MPNRTNTPLRVSAYAKTPRQSCSERLPLSKLKPDLIRLLVGEPAEVEQSTSASEIAIPANQAQGLTPALSEFMPYTQSGPWFRLQVQF